MFMITMAEKMSQDFYAEARPYNYNMAGGGDSASGGSGGSGMDCIQLRSPPGPFNYLITEQAKSFVVLQELQNEVGALLEFRDLVIETFPNLRSKMAPSTPNSGTRRDWEPGVRVRRKLAAASGDSTRTKPQASVQDSGFSTETSCGKDAHSSSASASTAVRNAPIEDELWALLDVIQRKGVRLRDEAELLKVDLDGNIQGRQSPISSDTAEESFARALVSGCPQCGEASRLRRERDYWIARSAELEAVAETCNHKEDKTLGVMTPVSLAQTPLGKLDTVLNTPNRPPRISTPDSKKFAAILTESNPVELQRQLLTSTVQTEVLQEKLKKAIDQCAALHLNLERTKEENDDLKFQLEERTAEGIHTQETILVPNHQRRASSQIENPEVSKHKLGRDHSSMRDMEPLAMPGDLTNDEPKISETPKRGRPSRIPLPGHKGAAPKPPTGRPSLSKENSSYRSRGGDSPGRPNSAYSLRSTNSNRSPASRLRAPSKDSIASKKDSFGSTKATNQTIPVKKTAVPVRKPSTSENKGRQTNNVEPVAEESYRDSLNFVNMEDPKELISEYLDRTHRLHQRLFYNLECKARPLPLNIRKEYSLAYSSPQNLALELSKSILLDNSDLSADIKNFNLKSINSHKDSRHYSDDSLWEGKPQHYFESLHSDKERSNSGCEAKAGTDDT